MAIGYITSLRTTRITALLTAIGTSGFLDIYDGTKPAVGGTATTRLAHIPLQATAGTVASGVLTFNTPMTASAAASGTATWARLTNSGGTAQADMGTTPITTVYLGTTPVTELYVGDTKMWP